MKSLIEPKQSALTITYKPDGGRSEENPPRFTWLPESEKDLPYRLQISQDLEFAPERTRTYQNLPYNFFTPDSILEAGTHYWRYALDGKDKSAFSAVRSFEIDEDSVKDPIPGGDARYEGVNLSHPRIWLDQEKIAAFQEVIKGDGEFYGFGEFYRRSVSTYTAGDFVKEPLPYPGNKRIIPLWRKNYMDCQDALCFIRSLAAGGRLNSDQQLVNRAKEALLEMAGWNPEGSTARDYNDECAFRVAYALAFGYDWLYEELSEAEKEKVREVLFLRTKQVADHVMVNTRIHYSLYDSHAVRSLSSVLLPCSIVLLGEYQEARQWLDYAIDYFNTIYTPWGGADGGWAEGPAYWTTGMAFVTEAFNTLKSFLGISLYQRPFFQKTGDFPLCCNPVDTYRTSFCDQSNLGDYPGHKVAFNIRQFAGVTGNADYEWYYKKVLEREPEISQEFYNKGWWDFYFDDMVYRYDYKDCVVQEPAESSPVTWFRDIGWVAINENRKDFDEHIFFLTKSSPYGSVSHSQGDQNTFVLFAYGEPLVITSGHYVGFNSSMHRDWRRQTKSHNALLIGGQGQYAGMDKVRQLAAKGYICQVEERMDAIYIKEEAAEAYREQIPGIQTCTREIYFVDHQYFILVDTVKTEEPAEVSWLLHSMGPFEVEGHGFARCGEKANLKGKIVYCSSAVTSIDQSDEFQGVEESELAGLDKQWHLTVKTGIANKHIIVSLLVPMKKDRPMMVNTIKDDQGMDIYYYFESEGKTFSLKVDGSFRH